MITNQQVREAPLYAMKNKKHIDRGEMCGCYYCLKVFNKSEIKEWTDNHQTALCPFCSVDSVLPETYGVPLDEQNLQMLYDHWF